MLTWNGLHLPKPEEVVLALRAEEAASYTSMMPSGGLCASVGGEGVGSQMKGHTVKGAC